NREPWVRFVTTQTAAALHHELAGLQRAPEQLELAAPLAVERPGVVLPRRKWKRRGQDAVQRQNLGSRIFDGDGARHDVVLGIRLETVDQLQADQLVLEYEVQH